MTKKIVLVSKVNILGEMVERALEKDPGLDLVQRFNSTESLSRHIEGGGSLDTDELLILETEDSARCFTERMASKLPGVRMVNLAADGSKVTLRWREMKVIQQITLPELIDLLRGEIKP